ncbi:MAG: hypothetical protein ABSH22_21980 [Tepidisphaeraceae bacterium]|jgi:hypothetical protein
MNTDDTNHNGNGENHDLARDPRGRFVKGNPGGPGNKMTAKAQAVKEIWAGAVTEFFTPATARGIVADLHDLAKNAKRDRDRLHAYDLLLRTFGLSKAEIEQTAETNFIINVSFTPKKPLPPDDPPKFIDQLPGGPTP